MKCNNLDNMILQPTTYEDDLRVGCKIVITTEKSYTNSGRYIVCKKDNNMFLIQKINKNKSIRDKNGSIT